MKVKKIRRTNLSRSLLIGVISVASVIGMSSVGFASWSFAASIEGDTVKVEATDIIVRTTDTDLGNFGISVSNNTASVEHYKYTIQEWTYILDDDGSFTYSEDDTDSESPLQEYTWVTHDQYGDLNIHSDLSVDLNTSTTSGLASDNINTIAYDDPTYTYLKIQISLSGSLLYIQDPTCTLKLNALPQYVMSPTCREETLYYHYYYYIPIKSASTMSLYTMALTDTITSDSGSIPFSLDFSFDLSENIFGSGNSNRIYQIDLAFTIISEKDYQTELTGGSTDEDS